jgi:ParB family chromosome partitioning protein
MSAMPDASFAGEPEPWAAPPPWIVPVEQLTAHPGNVREDLDLTPEFCASVAEAGVRIPLLVTPADNGYRVIEGHRRLAAAVKAGLPGVPCTLDPARAGDEAGQYLDMALANSDGYRRNFTPQEEASALFAASEAGATRTRIRKATGRSASDVKAALQAGGLSSQTRAQAAGIGRPVSLTDLALLAEFDGDEEATGQLLQALERGYAVEYTAERIRQDRAEAAQHDLLVTELQAAGVTVTDDLPEGATRLSGLTHDGEEITPDSHAACPGRGAVLWPFAPLQPVWYCASPGTYGHILPQPPTAPAPAGSAVPDPLPDPPTGPGDPGRKLVIEGNKAWAAAGEVRKRWLQTLLARRTAPRQIAPFLARQLLTIPEPLRANLATAHASALFTELAGQEDHQALQDCDTSPAGRLQLLMLAPIVTAYEQEISAPDSFRRSTWRQDRYSPCPRDQAGAYLAFLASLGHELSVIEQAVADGLPYTGDTTAETPDGTPDAPDTADGEATDDETADHEAADDEAGEELAAT